jgi:hypothetical protein
VVLAVVVDGRAGPGGVEDRRRLVEHAGAAAVVGLLPEGGELAAEAVAAQPDAEHEPPAGEPVQGDGLAGHLRRPAPGQRRDHRAEHDRAGGGGHRREDDPRIRHLADGRVPVDVVPHEDAVPAGLLRLRRDPGGHERIGELVEQRQPER